MASVSVSPQGYPSHEFDSAGETEDSWHLVDSRYASGYSNPNSVCFLSSPDGSLQGYVNVAGGAASASAPGSGSGSPMISRLSPPYQLHSHPHSNTVPFRDQTHTPPNPYLARSGDAAAYDFPVVAATSAPMPTAPGVTTHGDIDMNMAMAMNLDFVPDFQFFDPQGFLPPEQQFNSMDVYQLQYPSLFPTAMETFPLPRPTGSPGASSNGQRREPKRPAPPTNRKDKPTGVQKVKKPAEKSGFVVVTPEQINMAAAAGRHDCFDGGQRTTQRGRKGPLATSTKESALEVRRVGACFCCKSRKVKCDAIGACHSCSKIQLVAPQVVCWRFPDFIPLLFPGFMRTHFGRDEMAEFMSKHVGPMPTRPEWYQIELHSGKLFSATLVLKAKIFKPRDEDAHHGWHTQIVNDEVDLHKARSVPLLLDLDSVSQEEATRRKIRDYTQALSTEQKYAEQLTENSHHTDLPRKILTIVQKYAEKTHSPMVKKALSIRAAHYVLIHQLVLRNQSALRSASVHIPNDEYPTSVVLNRQLKLLVDQHLAQEVSDLFTIFNKSLKPKSKREWTPCLAAFLVLCLFMEDMECATDMFVLTKNEISLRNHEQRKFTRKMVLDVNEKVEKMPFQQFMWQFHHIYQTHSKDAATKAFNPLVDDTSFEMAASDDGLAAAEMIKGLRDLVGPDWRNLNALVRGPILPFSETEEHPWPRDVGANYYGRLAARFLMSFKDEGHIFGEMPQQGCAPPLTSAAVREWVHSRQRDMMDLSTL
ncbi:hypothetical protein ACHAQA_001035 [Verticillium albo-atrum]